MSHFITFRPKNQLEQESILNEMFNFSKEKNNQLMDYIFDGSHNFLYVDLSLKKSGGYIFYKNFNRLNITEE